MVNRAPVHKLGYGTNQNAQKSELKLVQQTGHPIKEVMQAVNELQEFTSYKTVPDTRGKIIFLYDDNQTEDLYFSAFFALYMGKLYELSNQFRLLMNRIIISKKPNSEVFQMVHRKKRSAT